MTKVRLVGNPSNLGTAISLLFGIQQLIADRDIGQWVGYTENEYVIPRPIELKLRIQLYSSSQPPFTKRLDMPFQRTYVSVPDIERSKLDWDVIKAAVGGTKGYTYGRSICTVEYSNSRQTQVYASNESEAEKIALRLAALSSNTIRKVTTSTLQKTGVYAEGQPMNRDNIKIYPGYLYILSRKRVLKTEEKAKQTKSGTYRERRRTIPLYLDKQPAGYTELINDLISG